MPQHISCLFLSRLLLPLILGACVLFRQNLFSFIYLLLLLCLPLFKIPDAKSMAGSTGRYLIAIIVLSVLTTIAQISFQIVLVSMPPYGHFLENSEMLETILRHIGLMKLDTVEFYTGIRMVAPDVLVLVTSIAVYTICSKAVRERRPSHVSDTSTPSTAAILPKVSSSLIYKKRFRFLVSIGKYVTLFTLLVAAAIRPSVQGGVYFLVFLGAMTWWACNKELGRAFAVILRCLLLIVVLHIFALFAVQLQIVQKYLPAEDCNYCRYLGLTVLVTRNSTNPQEETFADVEWDSYVNPIVLLWLFYIIVLESRNLLRPRVQCRDTPSDSTVSERTHLIRGMSPHSKYNTVEGPQSPTSLQQDVHGSVTITGEQEVQSSLFEKVLDCIMVVYQLLTRSSYIGTTIIMMAWSISYVSWLTFVLLLWASILWIIPNQRRSILRCSPFLVFYAIFLLLAQYLYSMCLNNKELPEEVDEFNLTQFGFVKEKVLPIKPIVFKSLFTCMFWITLRQYVQEKVEQKRSSALEDMVAPLQITVGTATRGFSEQQNVSSSQFMKKLGEYTKHLLIKYWIWVVAIMLFAISIIGTRMTVLRIIYMALFLIFILTFQLSYSGWRRMMYGFWLTVILYSMLILVLIYTYQFDHFPEYWYNYTGISEKLQLDLGLKKYETGELFVSLFVPAFFLVITVIQLHYLHKDFLALSDITSRSLSGGRPSQGSNTARSEEVGSVSVEQDGTTTVDIESPQEEKKKKISIVDRLRTVKHLSKAEVYEILSELKLFVEQVFELIWRFLELHLIKVMMLSIILMCLYDVCAVHFILLLIVVVSVSFGRNVLRVATHTISVLVSVLLLAKMIYQIEFFDHDNYDSNCTDGSVYNNADWVGFQKTDKSLSLPELLKGYIGLIILASFLAVVDIRQAYRRHVDGACLMRPTVMFPGIKRSDADKDFKSCLKYLFNYGFYRFGVEISLVMTVILIGSRMDFYAVLYGFWLCIMFSLKRETLSKIWSFYQIFIIIVIPVQYVMAVGLPPALCIIYPWNESQREDHDILQYLQDWMYLPDPVNRPPTYKLVCDFVLLLFVCHQNIVFRIEKRYSNRDYLGGSNKDITKVSEEPDFVNPVPDYISYVRSSLDVFKRLVLQSFLWITLGLVFLAGTNRVNVFSLGYLVGAFIFLWQGEDTYLLPVNLIIRRWNYLLGYNVFVIVIKAVLQIVGCVFIKDAEQYACWAVQLLGIGCIRKFGSLTVDSKNLTSSECDMPKEFVGLAWDGICFTALLLMRRIFGSYYFLHLVDETKAMTILASRGAELIGELRMNRITEQQEREREILEKIKVKMERIKATQQKIQGPMYKEPDNHFAAIRSGDYYMFEELDDVDLEEEKFDKDFDDTDSVRGKRLTLGNFLSTAMKTDMERAADMALAQGQARSYISPSVDAGVPSGAETEEARRRSSMPLPRRRSSSFFTAPQITPPHDPASSLSLHSDYHDLDHSPAESKISAQSSGPSVSFKRDPSPPSYDPGRDSPDGSYIGEEDSKPKEESTSIWHKIWAYIKFIWALLESAMVTMTKYLNRFSRDYRYVRKMLAMEKKMLKENPDFGKGVRDGVSLVWQPLPSVLNLTKLSIARPGACSLEEQRQDVADGSEYAAGSQHRQTIGRLSVPEIRILAPSLERGLDSESGAAALLEELEEKQEMSTADQPPFIRLLVAVYYTILSHSELLCYFMVFLLQIKSATILSLPLPLLVLLWGTLTVPRPTKTFWVTLIAYTEAVVILKCMFQFQLMPWNQKVIADNRPFHPPRIIGIERNSKYATYDLALLLIVFFHRYTLKSLGLWKSTYEDPVTFTKSEETFILKGSNSGSDSNMQVCPTDSVDQSTDNVDQSNTTIQQERSRRGSIRSASLHYVTTKGGRRLSAIKSSDDLDDNQTDIAAGGDAGQKKEEKQLVVVCTEPQNPFDQFPGIVKLATVRYFGSVKKFFENLLLPSIRVTADVYTYMFLCDFFNFMVVIFGFAAFGSQQGDGGVAAYLEENKVPIPFLMMLILQFALIIIDRALYLRKYILGKIVFQFLLVIGIHIWMFFILPAITERKFNAALPPQMWYMVKCFYLLLSAYQVRSGYPTRILGNVLCKRYNIINLVLFKVFMAIPFLFELRALMDWIWTDTSMTLFDWLKMEDIFANIFQHKCSRRMESEYPQPRGEKKKPLSKYIMGGAFLTGIIAIIWFPLVLFALGNTVGEASIPYDVTVSLRIGPYQPLYTMSAQNNSIYRLNNQQWTNILNLYKSDRVAQTFLSNYDNEDIGVVALGANSTAVWGISPPDLRRMVEEVNSTSPITFKLTWMISRRTNNPEIKGETVETQEWLMEPHDKQRATFAKMLNDSETEIDQIIIQNIFPKFVKVTNRNTARPVLQLMGTESEDPKDAFRSLSISLYNDSTEQWWELKEHNCSTSSNEKPKQWPYYSGCKQLILYTFNEKVFPAGLSIISGGGIIALYTTLVLVCFKLIRSIFTGMSFQIMFTDLPCVDRILQLCLDIYLVRESGELALEEDLFAKLVFLYRSPETLIKWSRPPEEEDDDGNDEQQAAIQN